MFPSQTLLIQFRRRCSLPSGAALRANLEARERAHSDTSSGEHLANRELIVTHVVLFKQSDLLEEETNASLHDLRKCRFGQVLLARDLLDERALLGHGLGGNILTCQVFRVGKRDVLSDRASRCLVGSVITEHDTNLRGKIFRCFVQVDRELCSRHKLDASEFNLFAEHCGLIADEIGNGATTDPVPLGDKVGLTREFDEGCRALAVVNGRDKPLRGRAISTFCVTFRTLEAENLGGLLYVATGFHECVLRVNHSGAQALAERLNVFERKSLSGGSGHSFVPFGASAFAASGVLSSAAGSVASACGESAVALGVAGSALADSVLSACATTGSAFLGPGATGAGVSFSAVSATGSAVSTAGSTTSTAGSTTATPGSMTSAAGSTTATAGAVAGTSVLDCRSSCSHSASGSIAETLPSVSGALWRSMSPSAAASAIMRVSRPTERIASSLPGMGNCTSSGSQLVSRIPITGIPSLRASSIARCSFLVSTIQIADGVFVRLRIPPSDLWSLSTSRFLIRSSFLVKPLVVPSKSSSSSSFMRARRLETVEKLVRRPPSHR